MAKRRSQVELAQDAEARLRKEKARLELDEIRLGRSKARLQQDSIKARRKMLSVHRAAEQNRLTKDWLAPVTSADSEILADMPRIVSRNRQICRDNPWGRSIVRAFRRNRIGTGITPQIDNKPWRHDFRRWSETPEMCDLEGKRTLKMIQDWACDEETIVGECFVVRWIIGNQLKLQCFEFEQLNSYILQDRDTGNEVRHGIEVDINGKPVAYHFFKQHPNDARGLRRPAPITLDSVRVPAHMVCHIHDPERARQSHGITRMRSVMRNLRDLEEYDAAQLRVARAEAAIGMIIKGGDDGDDPLMIDGLGVAYVDDTDDITPFIPSRPGGTYDPFVRIQVMRISAGVGLSPDQVTRSFDGGNFSSKRQGSIEDRRQFEPEIQRMASQLCEPVLRDWVFTWSMVNPHLSGDYFLHDGGDRTEWTGQGWEWVDPEQQGKGVERKMRLGLTSRTREAALLGTTVEQLDREIQSDGTLEVLRNLEPDKRENPAPESPTTPELDTGLERTGIADAD